MSKKKPTKEALIREGIEAWKKRRARKQSTSSEDLTREIIRERIIRLVTAFDEGCVPRLALCLLRDEATVAEQTSSCFFLAATRQMIASLVQCKPSIQQAEFLKLMKLAWPE